MTNSTLIAVFNGQISNQAVQLCNARDLHEFLESKQQYSHWIKDRISDYGFIQDEDYIIVTERTNGRPRKEYHITLDMGKELGMVERNEKGRQIRRYFIECEKRALQNQQQNLPLAQPDLAQIVQAVQQAMPQPKEIYQARNLHEVLPLAFLYNKIAVLAEDFLHLYKFLHQKGHGTMAEICKNHFNALNADTALMNRASCCIQRLTLDLSDEDQDTVRRLCLG